MVRIGNGNSLEAALDGNHGEKHGHCEYVDSGILFDGIGYS